MTDFFPPTHAEQLAAVEREIALRRRVYPNWVAAKKMSQDKADKEIAALEAVAKTLVRVDPLVGALTRIVDAGGDAGDQARAALKAFHA